MGIRGLVVASVQSMTNINMFVFHVWPKAYPYTLTLSKDAK